MEMTGAQELTAVELECLCGGHHLSNRWKKKGFERPSKFKDTVKMETFFVVGGAKERKEHYAAERVLRNIVDGGLRMTKPPHAMS